MDVSGQLHAPTANDPPPPPRGKNPATHLIADLVGRI
jgi:hypothetical protein